MVVAHNCSDIARKLEQRRQSAEEEYVLVPKIIMSTPTCILVSGKALQAKEDGGSPSLLTFGQCIVPCATYFSLTIIVLTTS